MHDEWLTKGTVRRAPVGRVCTRYEGARLWELALLAEQANLRLQLLLPVHDSVQPREAQRLGLRAPLLLTLDGIAHAQRVARLHVVRLDRHEHNRHLGRHRSLRERLAEGDEELYPTGVHQLPFELRVVHVLPHPPPLDHILRFAEGRFVQHGGAHVRFREEKRRPPPRRVGRESSSPHWRASHRTANMLCISAYVYGVIGSLQNQY